MNSGQEEAAPPAPVDWVERAAIGASLLCLVHCLALPLVIASLPALSGILSVPESVHLWILAFAVPSSLLALLTGRASHGAAYPVFAGIAGLILLAIGAIAFGGTATETPVTVAGSLFLAAAHIANWRRRTWPRTFAASADRRSRSPLRRRRHAAD